MGKDPTDPGIESFNLTRCCTAIRTGGRRLDRRARIWFGREHFEVFSLRASSTQLGLVELLHFGKSFLHRASIDLWDGKKTSRHLRNTLC